MLPEITEKIFKEGLELMIKKNADYTSEVIDNIELMGLYGVAVRMFDKISRLISLTHPSTGHKPNNESVRDTLIDIMNYGNIGVQVLEKRWTSKKYPDLTSKKDMDYDDISILRQVVDTMIKKGVLIPTKYEGDDSDAE